MAMNSPSARSDRLLGIVEGRCTTGLNGAVWQVNVVHELQAAGADRTTALHRILERYVPNMPYIPNMHCNESVHTWKR